MIFNMRLTVVYNTLNEFGEAVMANERDIKCAVVSQTKTIVPDDAGSHRRYDAQLIIPYKTFAPYTDIVGDDTVTLKLDGKTYRAVDIQPIRSGSGKVKYCSLGLKEKK